MHVMSQQLDADVPGKRALRKHITRQDLIRAGRDIFSVKGLYESRVEDITESAGIAKGTFYKYFDSKEALIRDVMAAGFEDLGRHIDAKLAGARELDVTVARLVEAHHEFFLQNPDMMRILHQVRGLLKFRSGGWKPLREVLAAHVGRLATRLGRAEHRERSSPQTLRKLAILIFGAVSGSLSVRVSIDPEAGLGPATPAFTRSMVAMAIAFISDPGRRARRRRNP
jgi:AcrR family transcriptional regulator